MTVAEPERVLWPLNGAGAPVAPSAPAVVGVADLRATNAAAVLAVVRSADPHPRLSELVKATSLSRPTVEAIAEELADCGLIEVAPALSARGQRSPGRPARRFRFRPHAGFVVGVDVRPRSVTARLADLDGEPVAAHRLTVHADISGRARAQAVVSAIRAAMTEADVDTPHIWAATIGTPGLVDRSNTRVRQADNLRTWSDTDIVGILREELHCPVAVENDANLAALGEQWHGGGKGSAEQRLTESGSAERPLTEQGSAEQHLTGPGSAESGSVEPGSAERALAESGSVESRSAELPLTGPGSAEQRLTGPGSAESGSVEPGSAERVLVESGSTESRSDGPSLAESGSAERRLTEPGAAEPSPADPPPDALTDGKTGEMLFVLLGERLGAGVITGGRLLRGHHGAAGEIGFIHFPDPSATPNDPAPASTPTSTPTPGLQPLADSVISGVGVGDPGAVLAVEGYGRRLAAGLAPVLLALDPALVVLGTGRFRTPDTTAAAELLLNAARDHAARLLVDPPSWRLSSLGDDAVLTGAVRFALSSVEVVLHTRPTSLMARVRGV
ncbi:ROK family protein [Streptomyces sp. NPDC005648]|uniref:ROK family transcriptional regulator n=1 Tax=Streptomyces sp. NPDC005648 TaxID=3157044 RepID=UPI0033ABC6ED